MKRSGSVLFTAAIAFGLTAMSSWSAAGSIFSDNFAADSSLAQPPWYNISSSSANSYALNVGTGLGLSTSTSGKFQEMVANFSAQSLAVGESMTLTVNFSGTGMWNGSAGDNGGIIFGLYNSGGTSMSADIQPSSNSGASSAYNGYFGDLVYNTGGGISSKFYSRTGSATAAAELGYYSKMTGSTLAQMDSVSASSSSDLPDSTPLSLMFTIQNAGAGVINFTTSINGTLDNFSFNQNTDGNNPPLYTTFDTLVFGAYDKTSATTLNISSIDISTVPEPTMFAFAGLSLAGLLLRFRRR